MERLRKKVRVIEVAIGAIVCALAAAIASLVLPTFVHRSMVPLIFSIVLVAVSRRYGTGAGVIGAMFAAAIFSYFLFVPVGSWHIRNPAASANVAWMFLIGVPLGHFFWIGRRQSMAKAVAERS